MSSAGVLSPAIASLILFGVFFSLMALRVPIAFALGLACLPILIIEPRLSPLVLFNQTFKSYNSFILLAVPFFLLTANLMNVGGITDRLVRLSRDLVGHFPGGLAQVNVVLSIFFAGISGSSTADAASQGKIFIEAQVKEGYDLSFSVAITAVSAVLAVIIPPSILMIVWGGTLTVSIGALFLAGIIPGLLLGFVQMATVHVYAKLRNYPKYPRSSLKEVITAIAISIPALMTPVIIIGGKVFGWFTATESAAIAVLYAGALSIFIYREMSGKALHGALLDTARLAAVALFCVGTASAFGWLLAYYQIPKALLAGVGSWGMGITETGFFIAFCFLVVGCFLDAIPAIIIVGTILEPLTRAVHMDPVHFAMIGIVSLAFGLVTPPYGLCLMISCAIAKVRIDLRIEGRDDHAAADARRTGADDRLSRNHSVPAQACFAGVPQMSGANFSLDGRTALVIGGTSGIGLEIARGFQAAGARVVVASRDSKKVESSVDELKRRIREARATRSTPLIRPTCAALPTESGASRGRSTSCSTRRARRSSSRHSTSSRPSMRR